MAAKFIRLFTSRLAWIVFIAVFIIGLGMEIFPWFPMIPFPAYSSTVRIQLPAESQSELKVIKSPVVLRRQIRDLDLQNVRVRRWGIADVGLFDQDQLCGMLSDQIVLNPVKNSNPPQTDIYYESDNADEAALVANSVAETFRDWEKHNHIDVQIVARATPALHPQNISKLNLAYAWAILYAKAAAWATLYAAIATILAVIIKNQITAPRTIPLLYPVGSDVGGKKA